MITMTRSRYVRSRGAFFPRVIKPALMLFAFFILSVPILAQEPQVIAPPPLKVLTKDEKARLSAETEVKERTNLALEFMNVHLTRAEEFNTKDQFPDMYKELGSFHALMDDTIKFLRSKNSGSSKILKNFKKFEMGLRTMAPRLEIVRRELPDQYEPYVRSLIKYVQDTREKAIEPLYGNTVVPNVRDQ